MPVPSSNNNPHPKIKHKPKTKAAITMKRSHMIDKLVVVGYSERELQNKTNDNLRSIYQQAGPLFRAHVEQINRVNRRHQREHEALVRMVRHDEACRQWARNWVHPKIKYPLQAPKVELEFGLADLYATAVFLVRTAGDQDAAAALRVIGPLPKKFRRFTEPVGATA